MLGNYSVLTSEQIIRNFQLYLLADIPLEERYLSIFNDLKNIFTDLNIYEYDDEYHSQFIFYGKSKDKLIIRYEEKSGNIWIDNVNLWNEFEKKYNISFICVQEILYWSVVNILCLEDAIHNNSWYLNTEYIPSNPHLKETIN